MLSRNDQPNIPNFNFGIDSVFNTNNSGNAFVPPPIENNFLLLDNTDFLLLDNTNFLLLA